MAYYVLTPAVITPYEIVEAKPAEVQLWAETYPDDIIFEV